MHTAVDVAVRVDEAGADIAARSVHHHGIRRHGGSGRANAFDLGAVAQHIGGRLSERFGVDDRTAAK